jgi:Ca-activated chloride channel family protein
MCSLILGAAVLPACSPQSPKSIAPGSTPTTPMASGDAPRLVELVAALDRRALLVDKPDQLVARVRVQAGALDRHSRPPIDVALVIDTSGSMEGQPIEDARKAAVALLEGMRKGDRLTVVTFDSKAEMLVPTVVLDDKSIASARASILGMQARGTTDLAAGLQLGLSQLAANMDAARARRIVLLSDGVPNDPSAIPNLADVARGSAISITALGFGLEYDETLLADVARRSGGRFHRISGEERIASAFTAELLRMDQAIAGNVLLTLRAGPGVLVKSVIGHPELPAGTAAALTLGDLSEGQAQELYVELETAGHREGAKVELLDVQLDYDDRTAAAGRLQTDAFLSLPTSTATAEADERDREVERGAARSRAAAATLDAVARSRAGDFVGAVAVLDDALAQAKRAAKDLDDGELAAHIEELGKLKKTLAAEAKRQAAELKRLAAEQAKLGHAGGTTRPRPMPAPMAAGEMATIKQSHAAAVDAFQAN